ncbi:ribosomal maturation YjgA family protein [Massilia genomosp. 1]|uniref:DUF2809 domain-containing protein n=1 Tax=Massilia genomosp. 1 TaxID=2609280 RepID=A0ABX0MEZ9_9BURK|nr:DUF2809 domain-containing protein [Massilia genomosp. 1]NHZ61379.1 DUF2809 domain-containing protein [Massilia genomosp. 1]
MVRDRRSIGAGCVIVIGCGMATRRYPSVLSHYFGNYPGDALWALLVLLLWAFCLPRAKTGTLVMLALGTAFAVEFSQLYQGAWIRHLRATRAGYLVLGSGFDWRDLLAYTVGIGFGALLERARGMLR